MSSVIGASEAGGSTVDFSAIDRAHMAHAVRLAAKGRFWARPNPNVGCVLAQGSTVVATGFTQPPGGDHAEAAALRIAGESARGATAYVTLEPCSFRGRTPACSGALIDAGVARVVIAVADPDRRVNGSGMLALRAAGVVVDAGLMQEQVETQLAGFLMRHRAGRPRVRLKLAMSLDGRTAMESGESQWITGPAARADVQRLRAESCAILTGSGTVLADDCSLTVRDEYFDKELLPPPMQRALRVVLDSQARIPAHANVLAGEQPTLVFHSKRVTHSVASEHCFTESDENGLDLSVVLTALAERGCNEVLVESGPQLAGAMLRANLVDQLIVYQAPKLLGSRARPLFDLPLDRMADAIDLRLLERRQIGVDQRYTFERASGS